MTVDLITNRDIFDDVYPSEAEQSDESDHDASSSETEPEAVKALIRKTEVIEAALKEKREDQSSAFGRLTILENYGRSISTSRPNNLEECISTYNAERKKAFEDHKIGGNAIEELEKELAKLAEEKQKLNKSVVKEKAKATKAKLKQKEKKERAAKEKMEAKRRLQMERIQFWPKKVYRVVLSLDTNSDLTPASSRRGSIDSVVKPSISTQKGSDTSGPESPLDSCRISLSVSYITYSASWSPRYDLSLTTTKNSGLIIYRADFYNATSETWRDAKVILSTSQTSFQGLGEPIPSLQPWHLRLENELERLGKPKRASKDDVSQALFSRNEQEYEHKVRTEIANNPSQHRNELFGLNRHDHPKTYLGNNLPDYQMQLQMLEQQNMKRLAMARQEQTQAQQQAQQQTQHVASQQQHQHLQSNSLGQAQMRSGANQPYQFVPLQPGLFDTAPPQSIFANSSTSAWPGQESHKREDSAPDLIDYSDEELDVATLSGPPQDPTLSFQQAIWEESGLTATYDVPGTRTLPPSPTTRRHKIASVSLKDIQLSYVLVPKLRAAAFLKARLRNWSSITLLKGAAGLTLDGTFLGNTTLPRCSAGESFSLNLGADPAITVTYAKPLVRRSETGLFQTQGNCIYTRAITITNTKPHNTAAVEALVLDQIPVSEDERLKVVVLEPKGLLAEGGSVKTGSPVKGEGKGAEGGRKEAGEWGRATASLRKGGEVAWEVRVNGGQGVRLGLEYEARFPGGGVVVDGK